MKFRGIFTAIITPFLENLKFDAKNFEKILEAQIAAAVDGIVVLGTTGESPTISHDEHQKIVELAVKIARGRIKIIAGTGSNSTDEAIKMTTDAEKIGADAALLVNPYYNKPTQKGLFEHFSAIAAATKLPIILYNIAGRTGVNLETKTLLKLTKIENIVAVKEASGDLEQIREVIAKVPKNFSVLSGNDDQNFEILKIGGHGAISVLSNILPAETKKMINFGLEKNFAEMEKMHQKFLPLVKNLFIETNPQPIKTLFAYENFCAEIFRLPLTKMEPENREKLISCWQKLKSEI